VTQAGPDIPLRRSQRRRFEVVLQSLDEALSRLETLVSAPETLDRPLHRLVADIAPDRLQRARPLVQALRARITEGIARMDLQPGVMRTSQYVRAILSTQRIQLEDSRAAALRGYAALRPEAAARVEQYVGAMVDDLDALTHTLLAPTSPDESTDGNQ